MIEFLSSLFDPSGFTPRWQCGQWSSGLGWIHIASDLAIWAAYAAIPVVLIFYTRARRDIPFPRVFWLFAAFILACGTVHLVEAVIFWIPIYRFSGFLKLSTALVSWATVIMLVRIMPRVLHLPKLAATNQQLSQEIHHRVSVEASLRSIQARYEALLLGTRNVVWTCDSVGNFDSPQASWQRYTGQSFDQHVGMGWMHAISEGDRSRLQADWKASTDSSTVFRSRVEVWNFDAQQYRSCILEAVPVRDERGEVAEWVGTVDDVHEQFLAEDALRFAELESNRQRRELELLYDTSPVGMSLINREHRYVRINAALAKINGFPVGYHIGKARHEIIPQLDDQLGPMCEQVFETGIPILNQELRGRSPHANADGCWLVSLHPLCNDNGQVWAVSTVVQDITARTQMEEALRESEQRARQANTAKSQFLANMSHEIRTPMAAILGYADILLDHLSDPDNRNCVFVIKKNGEHLLEIINDILDLTSIEAGKLRIHIEPTALPQLLGDLYSLMNVRAQEKGLTLRIVAESQIPETVQFDSTRVRQILINLIGNAVKFTDKGSVALHVRLLLGELPQIEFRVSDTGRGISDEMRPKLFQPFSQGDSSNTREHGGNGLGLAISYRFVEMLGGQISVTSKEGEGSCFTVVLPCGDVTGAALIEDVGLPQPVTLEKPDCTSLLNCRVLVVDDRRDVRFITQHFLEAAGATVVTAEDGAKGVAAVEKAFAEQKLFDIIVMDMQMPIMDGRQATALLRERGVIQPIIALTAHAMKGERESCIQSGFDDFLSKPIDHDTFVAMVARYTQSLSLDQVVDLRSQRLQKL